MMRTFVLVLFLLITLAGRASHVWLYCQHESQGHTLRFYSDSLSTDHKAISKFIAKNKFTPILDSTTFIRAKKKFHYSDNDSISYLIDFDLRTGKFMGHGIRLHSEKFDSFCDINETADSAYKEALNHQLIQNLYIYFGDRLQSYQRQQIAPELEDAKVEFTRLAFEDEVPTTVPYSKKYKKFRKAVNHHAITVSQPKGNADLTISFLEKNNASRLTISYYSHANVYTFSGPEKTASALILGWKPREKLLRTLTDLGLPAKSYDRLYEKLEQAKSEELVN